MLSPLFQGLILGAGMILPIGAQNSHILNHGIKRHHHFLVATICMICDVSLIALGIFGGAKLLSSSPLLMSIVSWGGILFLSVYGAMSFYQVWKNSYLSAQTLQKTASGTGVVVGSTLAVSLLNPHVYLDTVVILGGVGGQFIGYEKIAFAVGTMLASLIWFYTLAGTAAKLSPWLNKAKIKRRIDLLIGIIMFAIAFSLFNNLNTSM